MSEMIVPSLTQLAWQSPVLLVYLVGMILALACWRRYPGPCSLVLIATALLLFLTVLQTFLTQYLFHVRTDWGWDNQKLSWILSAIGLACSFLRALGLSLLLAAVFLGRRGAKVEER